jgi:hypothetical protein
LAADTSDAAAVAVGDAVAEAVDDGVAEAVGDGAGEPTAAANPDGPVGGGADGIMVAVAVAPAASGAADDGDDIGDVAGADAPGQARVVDDPAPACGVPARGSGNPISESAAGIAAARFRGTAGMPAKTTRPGCAALSAVGGEP